MTVTNNTVEQINTALLGLKLKEDNTDLLEQKRQTLLDEDEEVYNPIEDATFKFENAIYRVFNNDDYESSSSTNTITSNYFVFGELMMVWGTVCGGNVKNGAIQYQEIDNPAGESFQGNPIYFMNQPWEYGSSNVWNNASAWISYNRTTNKIRLRCCSLNDGYATTYAYHWFLIGKVKKEAI